MVVEFDAFRQFRLHRLSELEITIKDMNRIIFTIFVKLMLFVLLSWFIKKS